MQGLPSVIRKTAPFCPSRRFATPQELPCAGRGKTVEFKLLPRLANTGVVLFTLIHRRPKSGLRPAWPVLSRF